MATKEVSARKDRSEAFARRWFSALAAFHRIRERDTWQFTEADVIAFLKSKVKQKMPTRDRLAIAQSLIWYRNHIRKTDQPSLERIRIGLQERLAQERLKEDDVPISEVIGRINPREPDVIQRLRQRLISGRSKSCWGTAIFRQP